MTAIYLALAYSTGMFVGVALVLCLRVYQESIDIGKGDQE